MQDDKLKEGYEILNAFFSQLEGENDIYKEVVIEETLKIIFEIVYGKKWED